MTTYTTPPVDVVLEAPISVGMLAIWAGDHQDEDMSAVVTRAMDAGLRAGVRALQDEGGWAVLDGGRRFERDRLDVQPYRHYLAGDAADVARPHEHLYIALTTTSGLSTHRAVLPEAATIAQTRYSLAMRKQLTDDGIDLVRAETPAGWELSAAAGDAAAMPRHGCPSAISVAEQIVPLNRWGGLASRKRTA
jgi:hypothetical protein